MPRHVAPPVAVDAGLAGPVRSACPAGRARRTDARRAPAAGRDAAAGRQPGAPGLAARAGARGLRRDHARQRRRTGAGHAGAGAVRRARAVGRHHGARHGARAHPRGAGAGRPGQPHAGLRGRLCRPHRQPPGGAVLPRQCRRQHRRRPAHRGRRQRGLRARLRLGRRHAAHARGLDGRAAAAVRVAALRRRRAGLAHHGRAPPAARAVPPAGEHADPARRAQLHRQPAAAAGRGTARAARVPDAAAQHHAAHARRRAGRPRQPAQRRRHQPGCEVAPACRAGGGRDAEPRLLAGGAGRAAARGQHPLRAVVPREAALLLRVGRPAAQPDRGLLHAQLHRAALGPAQHLARTAVVGQRLRGGRPRRRCRAAARRLRHRRRGAAGLAHAGAAAAWQPGRAATRRPGQHAPLRRRRRQQRRAGRRRRLADRRRLARAGAVAALPHRCLHRAFRRRRRHGSRPAAGRRPALRQALAAHRQQRIQHRARRHHARLPPGHRLRRTGRRAPGQRLRQPHLAWPGPVQRLRAEPPARAHPRPQQWRDRGPGLAARSVRECSTQPGMVVRAAPGPAAAGGRGPAAAARALRRDRPGDDAGALVPAARDHAGQRTPGRHAG